MICDSPAGIERGATLAMRYADAAVIVTNPEVSSVRDSDRIIGLLDSKTEMAENGERMEKHLLITRYDPVRAESRRHALDRGRARDPVDHRWSASFRKARRCCAPPIVGAPVTMSNPDERAGLAYKDAARRLQGRSARSSCRPRSGGCSEKSSDGGRHERFRFFRRRGSAPVARERLQILLAHERKASSQPDLLMCCARRSLPWSPGTFRLTRTGCVQHGSRRAGFGPRGGYRDPQQIRHAEGRSRLARDQEKWAPVFRPITRQIYDSDHVHHFRSKRPEVIVI